MPNCKICGREYVNPETHRTLIHPDQPVEKVTGEQFPVDVRQREGKPWEITTPPRKPMRVQIGQAPRARFKTEVSGPGGGPAQLAGGGPGTEPLRIRTEKAPEEFGFITGRVVDATPPNNPIRRGKVEGGGDSDSTGTDGRFRLDVPAGRNYTVRASADKYHRGFAQSGVIQPNVVDDVGDIQLQPIAEERTGKLEGYVEYDDRDGKTKPAHPANVSVGGLVAPNRADGYYVIENIPAGRHEIVVTANGFDDYKETIRLRGGQNESKDFKLKKKEGIVSKTKGGVKKGLPHFWDWKWWTGKEEGGEKGKNQLVRLGITALLSFLILWGFYYPFFGAIEQDNPVLKFVLPVLIIILLFFFIAPKFEEKPDWGPFIFALIVSLGTLGALLWAPGVPSFLKARYFIVGIPLGLFLFINNVANPKKQGMGKTLLIVVSTLAIIGFLLIGTNLIKSGKAFDIDTYLKTLDVLKLVGVPEDTVEGMKSGVRNTLSFLQFKGAQPTKPEAKKIGGFEAIELKFGSRHNNYLLPTLFARMDYVLPVTVTNPNKFDTKLVVENFKIEDVFLKNGDNRIICGSTTDPTKSDPISRITLGDINSEEEKLTAIDFKDKTDCRRILALDRGYDVNSQQYNNFNPMFPAKFRLPYEDKTKNEDNKTEDCRQLCNIYKGPLVVANHNQIYGAVDELDTTTTGSRYVSSDSECECKVKRRSNIMDELCFFDNNKAKVTLSSSYGFKVQGKGELILVKTDTDRKLAPKPTITSSAGPLTVTTYFVSDVHVFEGTGASRTTKMFVQIENAGDGSATITSMKINDKISTPVQLDNKVGIKGCSLMPNPKTTPPTTLPVSKDGTTIVCDVEFDRGASSVVTGSYRTLPVIVDLDYSYSQIHSTSINVKKETIPEGVDDIDQIQELDTQFKPLPYYCPNVNVPGSDTKPLKIYDTDVPQSSQTSSTSSTTTPPIQTSQPSTQSECDQNVQDRNGNKLECRSVSGITVKVCCFQGESDADCKSVFDNIKTQDSNVGNQNYCTQKISGGNGFCFNGEGECKA